MFGDRSVPGRLEFTAQVRWFTVVGVCSLYGVWHHLFVKQVRSCIALLFECRSDGFVCRCRCFSRTMHALIENGNNNSSTAGWCSRIIWKKSHRFIVLWLICSTAGSRHLFKQVGRRSTSSRTHRSPGFTFFIRAKRVFNCYMREKKNWPSVWMCVCVDARLILVLVVGRQIVYGQKTVYLCLTRYIVFEKFLKTNTRTAQLRPANHPHIATAASDTEGVAAVSCMESHMKRGPLGSIHQQACTLLYTCVANFFSLWLGFCPSLYVRTWHVSLEYMKTWIFELISDVALYCTCVSRVCRIPKW